MFNESVRSTSFSCKEICERVMYTSAVVYCFEKYEIILNNFINC